MIFRHASKRLFPLLALLAVFFPAAAQERGIDYAAGLKPLAELPAAVTVESGPQQLDIRIDFEKHPLTGEQVFYLLAPRKANTRPICVDYRFRLDPQNNTTATLPLELTPAAEKEHNRLRTQLGLNKFLDSENAGILRFNRLLRVTLRPRSVPLPPNGTAEPLFLHYRYRWPDPLEGEAPESLRAERDWGFARVLAGLCANPEAQTLYAWRDQSPHEPELEENVWTPRDVAPQDRWLRILIDREDFYAIGPDTLRAMRLDPAHVDLAALAIYSRGRRIPTLAVGPPRGGLGPGSRLLFHGLASQSPYSPARAYWLRVSDSPLPPLDYQRLSPPAETQGLGNPILSLRQTYHVEKDEELLIETGNFLSIKGKHWAWGALPGQGAAEFLFDLPPPDPRSEEEARLTLTFHIDDVQARHAPLGPRTPEISLRLNDAYSTRIAAPVLPRDVTRTLRLPGGVLKPGANRLELAFAQPHQDFPGQDTPLYLDHLDIDYRRALFARQGRLDLETTDRAGWHLLAGFGPQAPFVFDLTEETSPRLHQIVRPNDKVFGFHEQRPGRRIEALTPQAIAEVSSHTLWLRPALSAGTNAADYLLIYHRRFADLIDPLLALQRDKGLLAQAVDIEAVFQEYGGGESSPLALKRFLHQALRRWEVPPTYVCLLGDATSDYRDELGTGLENLIPAYSFEAQNGETWASELWYTQHNGSDLLPDLILGRISARYPDDAREMLRKTLDYQRNAPLGAWRGRFGFCSDDTGFAEAAERLFTEYRPRAVQGRRMKLEDFPFEDNFYLPRDYVREKNLKVSTEATLWLLRTFNRGVSVMFFFGHGSPNIWTDERIWFGGDSPNSDNLNLRNEGRLPFLATFTCNHGAFDYPMPKWHISISEDMMRVPGGGAIALWVPSGPGKTHIHEKIAHVLMRALFEENATRAGELDTLTKSYYLLETNERASEEVEMARMYVLLGDPALDLAVPDAMQRGRVSPERIPYLAEYLGAGASNQGTPIRFESDTPLLVAGRFQAVLYDPFDKEFFRDEPRKFSDGRIVWEYELPPRAEWGEWTLRIYYAEDRAAAPSHAPDGLLYGSFRVGRPFVRLSKFSLLHPPDPADGLATVSLGLDNASQFEAQGLTLSLRSLADSATTLPTQRKPLGLAPDERRDVLWPLHLQPGLNFIEARVAPFTRPLDPALDTQDRRSLVVHLPRNDGQCRLLSHPRLTEYDWDHDRPNSKTGLRPQFYFEGFDKAARLPIKVLDRDGKPLAESSLRVTPKDSDSGSATAELELDPKAVKAGSGLTLQVQDNTSTRILFSMPFELSRPELPDLRFLPGSLRFEPPRPVEGNTVFIDATVQNVGRAVARPFHVRAWNSIGKQRRQAIQSLTHPAGVEHGGLAPGRSRDIRIRWDPPAYGDNAGTHTVLLELDSRKRNAESNEDNNQTEATLRVLSRSEVKAPVELQQVRWIGNTEVELQVGVRNLGEEVGRDRVLGFYRRPPQTPEDYQDPEFLVHEMELPPIGGLQTRSFSHRWRLRPGDENSTPTAAVYRPLANIRSGLSDLEDTSPDW